MKTALVIMTLLGCDCDMRTCQVIQPVDAASWTSVKECEAALSLAISRQQAADYPAISGICEVHGEPLADPASDGSKDKVVSAGDVEELPLTVSSFVSHPVWQTRRLLLKIVH